MNLKIATFNIKDNFNSYCGGISKKINRPLEYSKIINDNKIDVIATQELTSRFTKNLQKYLTKYSFYGKYRFSKFLKFIPYNENNDIITTKNVINMNQYKLPGTNKIMESIKHKTIFKRLVNILIIEEEHKKVYIINTHLSSSSQIIKNIQINKLINIIEEYKNYPIILMGDFNMSAFNNTYKKFLKYMDKIGIKEVNINGSTFKDKQIDHILISNNIKVKNIKIIDCSNLSDHHGIVLEISV